MLQLTEKSRKDIHKNCTQRILAADQHITEIKSKGILNYKDEQELTYLFGRKNELTLSVFIAYNTNRIEEDRDEKITFLENKLKSELGPNEKILAQRHLAELIRSKNCKVCSGRGWIGFKENTGEFSFCNCVIKTMHHYIKVTK